MSSPEREPESFSLWQGLESFLGGHQVREDRRQERADLEAARATSEAPGSFFGSRGSPKMGSESPLTLVAPDDVGSVRSASPRLDPEVANLHQAGPRGGGSELRSRCWSSSTWL